ncbi:MAG: cob(I)yrinic acid a,c-diamide adenosyltransferase [Rhodospirillaceae bacterium]|nr:cob(I)yrinic acid a,c-diamide adenosyltransferase [Rhodospirillaceae bacterium]|tara:strand:- start:9727 stop:10347 length:621 start_codon:yes stop_codon:yes gene_type:complete
MTIENNEAEEIARANEKRRKHKEAKDRLLARKTKTGGLLIVHTGKGKGKTTAAMGMVMRCIGHGMKVGIVQFVKGAWETGERDVLDKFPDQVDIAVMGEGFTWETQDRTRDIAAAEKAWERGKEMIASGDYGFVLLDEINIVLRYDYLSIADVVEVLRKKPDFVHVACTGRNAKPELIDAADLVTEMAEIKHHFRADFKAQSGIEF